LEKIRVGAVSYRNAKPLVYGLELPEMTNIIDLSFDYPARLVEQLKLGTIDVGLIPVAAINRIPGARIVGRHGIAADGAVGSVALFSHCRIEEVEEVLLDYQSRTSVELTKLLLREYWKIDPRIILTEGDEYIRQIEGNRAGLIIGDRALLNVGQFPYVYDLSEAWKALTNLPFIFAAWVSVKELSATFIDEFDAANERGLFELVRLSNQWALPGVDMLNYYTQRIHYRLDDQKKSGMDRFLSMIKSVPLP
jgi:chorismate dehydratase